MHIINVSRVCAACGSAVAEVSRYEGKVEKAGEAYQETNRKSKKEMIAAKKAHDQLVDMQLVTAIVTQVGWCSDH
jgi:hypothetical protein